MPGLSGVPVESRGPAVKISGNDSRRSGPTSQPHDRLKARPRGSMVGAPVAVERCLVSPFRLRQGEHPLHVELDELLESRDPVTVIDGDVPIVDESAFIHMPDLDARGRDLDDRVVEGRSVPMSNWKVSIRGRDDPERLPYLPETP